MPDDLLKNTQNLAKNLGPQFLFNDQKATYAGGPPVELSRLQPRCWGSSPCTCTGQSHRRRSWTAPG